MTENSNSISINQCILDIHHVAKATPERLRRIEVEIADIKSMLAELISRSSR